MCTACRLRNRSSPTWRPPALRIRWPPVLLHTGRFKLPIPLPGWTTWEGSSPPPGQWRRPRGRLLWWRLQVVVVLRPPRDLLLPDLLRRSRVVLQCLRRPAQRLYWIRPRRRWHGWECPSPRRKPPEGAAVPLSRRPVLVHRRRPPAATHLPFHRYRRPQQRRRPVLPLVRPKRRRHRRAVHPPRRPLPRQRPTLPVAVRRQSVPKKRQPGSNVRQKRPVSRRNSVATAKNKSKQERPVGQGPVPKAAWGPVE